VRIRTAAKNATFFLSGLDANNAKMPAIPIIIGIIQFIFVFSHAISNSVIEFKKHSILHCKITDM
jgi:hypothetical protein